MLYCENCGKLFESPDYAEDFESEYFGAIVHHFVSVCPYCRSDEIRTAEKCPICGEYHTGEDEVCDLCNDEIEEAIRELKEQAISGELNWDAFSEALAERL